MKTTINYIGRVLDRLERRCWPQWKIQLAYEELRFRRALEWPEAASAS